jgi:hypothetical protein
MGHTQLAEPVFHYGFNEPFKIYTSMYMFKNVTNLFPVEKSECYV